MKKRRRFGQLIVFFVVLGICLAAGVANATYTDYIGAGHDDNVTATGYYEDETATGQKTVDGSGLSGGTHSAEWNDHWCSWEDGGPTPVPSPNPARGDSYWIHYDFGEVYTLADMWVWNYNEVTERGLQNVIIDYSLNGTDWTELESYTWPQATGSSSYPGFQGPDFAGESARYVLITATSNYGDTMAYGLAEVKFNLGASTNPKAINPDPADGLIGVSLDADLSWTAGYGADSHDVYFSTDETAVTIATDPNTLPGRGNQTETTYDPCVLDYGTRYCWRIDEVDGGTTTTGDVWSFTTRPRPAFGAAYCKIDPGQSWESDSRTTEHPDIRITFDNTDDEFVFWRASSYLPYWKTNSGQWYVDEIVPRSGDGTGIMPDKVNMYSHVRIIESSPQQVVVHWRYLPEFTGGNPKTNEDHTTFVDEYFTIIPDGNVTRTIKEGTEKYDDWADPLNVTTQTFQLTSDGITDVQTTGPGSSPPSGPVDGNPIKGPVVGSPVAWWKFDEAQGDTAEESVSGYDCTIAGHKTYWRAGVSGTALEFDGYTSLVSLPLAQAPAISTGLTLEAWVAPGAYPWRWEGVPIVQQSHETGEQGYGYFLGVNREGLPVFKVRIGGVWEALEAGTGPLGLLRWTHLAATYDGSTGKMSFYIDGAPTNSKWVSSGSISTTADDVQIGQGEPLVVDEIHITDVSIDGLIDEVKVYDTALNDSQILQSYNNFKPSGTIIDNPDMQARGLPERDTASQFGARYTKLQYHETWDGLFRFSDDADVIVEFDELPIKWVFWRGTLYVPYLINEQGQWYTNSWNEHWQFDPGDTHGYREPISDKQCYYNHVRILENTDARVVVHWRYPLVAIDHYQAHYDPGTGWGDWSDWYYYIYPDGVTCKKMTAWTSWTAEELEWYESKSILDPGQIPEDLIELYGTVTLATIDGWSQSYDWVNGPPVDFGTIPGLDIQTVDFTGQYDPFTIVSALEWYVYAGGEEELPRYTHYPVSQIKNDGCGSPELDRPGATGYTHLCCPTYASGSNWMTKVILEGMSNQSISELRTLAKSWMNASSLSNTSGCTSQGYDETQRAYVLTANSSTMSFTLNGSSASPVVNPCFVIKNWDGNHSAALTIDAVPQTLGPDFRQGIIWDTDRTQTMVIWLDLEATSAVDFEVIEETGPDIDGSGYVDFIDFAMFAAHWLETGCAQENNWCGGSDFTETRNGDVDLNDLKEFTNDWLSGK